MFCIHCVPTYSHINTAKLHQLNHMHSSAQQRTPALLPVWLTPITLEKAEAGLRSLQKVTAISGTNGCSPATRSQAATFCMQTDAPGLAMTCSNVSSHTSQVGCAQQKGAHQIYWAPQKQRQEVPLYFWEPRGPIDLISLFLLIAADLTCWLWSLAGNCD